MPATYVQSAAQQFAQTTVAKSLVYPSPVTAGNLLVLCVGSGNVTHTVTDSLGQTWTQADTYIVSTATRLSVWYKENTLGGPLTVTMLVGGITTPAMAILEYSGVLAVNSVFSTKSNTGTSTQASTGAVTVNNSRDLIVTGVAASATVFSANAPYTLRQTQASGAGTGIGVADLVEGEAGTGTVFPMSSFKNWAVLSVTFKQAVLPVILYPSANVVASGANTTAQLNPPTGKTTALFGGGRFQDDENPTDNVDLGVSTYREDEWVIKIGDNLPGGTPIEFRVTRSDGTPLDVYAIMPMLTAGVAPTFNQEGYRFHNNDGSESTATFLAAQDTPATLAAGTTLRLRTLVDVTGDAIEEGLLLEYQVNGGSWIGVQ